MKIVRSHWKVLSAAAGLIYQQTSSYAGGGGTGEQEGKAVSSGAKFLESTHAWLKQHQQQPIQHNEAHHRVVDSEASGGQQQMPLLRNLSQQTTQVFQDLRDDRNPYRSPQEAISDDNLPSRDPFVLFNIWFKEAKAQSHRFEELNGVVLSTVSRDRTPSSRLVLLKEYSYQGFKFFTNYDSRKGKELVRIEGNVEKLSEEESTEYWKSRPEASKASAAISEQSTVVPSRQFAEKLLVMTFSYASPKHDIQIRVGAVYLLYSIYYRQIPKYRMMIRVTPSQFKEFEKLADGTLTDENHLDTLWCIWKLIWDGAFYITKYPDEHNPLTYKNYDNVEKATAAAELRNEKMVLGIAEDSMVEELRNMHEQYAEAKEKLRNIVERSSFVSLSQTHENPADIVKQVEEEFQEKIERRVYSKGRGERERERRESHRSPVKDRRAAIREKAYSGLTKQARHRRHRQQDGDAESSFTADLNEIIVDVIGTEEQEDQPESAAEGEGNGETEGEEEGDVVVEGVPKRLGRPKRERKEKKNARKRHSEILSGPPTKRGRPSKVQAPMKKLQKEVKKHRERSLADEVQDAGIGLDETEVKQELPEDLQEVAKKRKSRVVSAQQEPKKKKRETERDKEGKKKAKNKKKKTEKTKKDVGRPRLAQISLPAGQAAADTPVEKQIDDTLERFIGQVYGRNKKDNLPSNKKKNKKKKKSKDT